MENYAFEVAERVGSGLATVRTARCRVIQVVSCSSSISSWRVGGEEGADGVAEGRELVRPARCIPTMRDHRVLVERFPLGQRVAPASPA